MSVAFLREVSLSTWPQDSELSTDDANSTTRNPRDRNPEAIVRHALAVRLNESTRIQLDIIAHLNDRTVPDEVRLAMESWIEKAESDPSVQRRAEGVRGRHRTPSGANY